MYSDDIPEQTAEEEVLELAKKRYNAAFEHWNEFFESARETLKFIEGDQWTDQLRNARENAGLPCLTANMLGTFLRQITNETRKNTPCIQVDPKDDGSDQDTAEIFSDLIRSIEQRSDASFAYDNAVWYAAATGLGFMRVISEFESSDSFDKKLTIEAIEDPETVICDPSHKALDASDMEYCFIITSMSKEEYNRKFQNSKLAKMNEQHSFTSNTSKRGGNDWITENEVVVAEYYYKSYEPKILYRVFDPSTGTEYVSYDKPSDESLDNELLLIIEKRPTVEVTINWCKINDVEILEETNWPGSTIPVIAVKGEELWVEGKRKLKGAVKDAIDSQRAFNYFQSLQAELVSMAPKAPWIGTPEQFANFEHDYRDANTSSIAYLRYNPVVKDGVPIPPPSRQAVEVPIQASMQQCAQARDNLKSIFGIYDASLGAQGNETSGVAILSRQEQSHNSNYHYYDNLSKAIQQVGNILVETIPVYYGDERTVQLIKRNGETATLRINGADSKHQLTTGGYGVIVETGANYATRRQASVTAMTALGGVYPSAMPLIADLIAQESDWPGAKQVASRLRLALPPQIQQAEAASGNEQDPKQAAQFAIQQLQQVQARLQQAEQLIQHGHQEIQNLNEENKLLKQKAAIDLQKTDLEYQHKDKQLRVDELTTELEFKIKLKELAIQQEQLALEKAKFALETVETEHEFTEHHHDRTLDHIEVMTNIKDDKDEGLYPGPDSEVVAGEINKDALR